jgi:competence protein ComEA
MRKSAFAGLLFPLLIGVSAVASAAENTTTQVTPHASVQAVQAPAQVFVINLNTADELTLERELVGVGAVKAKAIIAYREANGPFASVDELLEVKGIGAATLEKNRAKLSIN